MARTPIWRSIADTVRNEIGEGHYAEGSRLPTEAVLSERFGVNRHTVRHALGHLIDEGLLHARRGSGVFVLGKPLDYPISDRVRFHQNLLAAGRMPEKKVLSVETRAASAGDARRLKMKVGEAVTVHHCLSFADGTPIAISESRFPEERLPGIAEALKSQPSVTNALSEVGISDYVRASTRLAATTATATQALHLRLPEGAPLLFSQSINQDVGGYPVEHGQAWFASQRITLTLDHLEDVSS